jgi:uncharacterized membrane protein YidH (DUF202 family)
MTDVSTQSDSGSRNSPPRKSNLFLTFAVIVIVLVVVGAFLMFQRRSQYEALAKDTESLAVPTVAIIHPSAEPGDENLVLPSTLQPYVE